MSSHHKPSICRPDIRPRLRWRRPDALTRLLWRLSKPSVQRKMLRCPPQNPKRPRRLVHHHTTTAPSFPLTTTIPMEQLSTLKSKLKAAQQKAKEEAERAAQAAEAVAKEKAAREKVENELKEEQKKRTASGKKQSSEIASLRKAVEDTTAALAALQVSGVSSSSGLFFLFLLGSHPVVYTEKQ